MVKLGFIAEGPSDKTILASNEFKEFLNKLGIAYLDDVIYAEGVANLRKHKIKSLIQVQRDKGADKIVILADSDDNCITNTKQEIDPDGENIVIVAVQAIEAWFLADTTSISKFFQKSYYCENPETIPQPFDFIKTKRMELIGIGAGKKPMLAKSMLASGFSLESAAAHPNCPSAKYFLEKLTALSLPKAT